MIGKIAIIGGGNIGGVCVSEIATRRLARRAALVDIKEPDFAKGKCLDIAEATPVYGVDCNVEGSKTYEVLEGADFVINTAGVPRTMRPDGTCFEGEGIAPDVTVRARSSTFKKKDPVIARALEVLRGKAKGRRQKAE